MGVWLNFLRVKLVRHDSIHLIQASNFSAFLQSPMQTSNSKLDGNCTHYGEEIVYPCSFVRRCIYSRFQHYYFTLFVVNKYIFKNEYLTLQE